ncbi:MAG: hypothetical protein J6A29_00910 [Clostridia bacterium]|nr:hypothetical protein [Clostridia bacterium]
MALFFIEESKEKNKYKFKINNILNKIEEKTDGNRVFLSLPIKEDKIKEKKIKKIVKQMKKYKIKTTILSESLYNIEFLKNELYSMNISILDGKYLFKLLIEEVIKYICKKSNTNIEKMEISILTNDVTNINNEIIISLAEKVKTLNIITNHIEEFRNIEDYLYNEKGIIIKISNNYKTALQKTNVIVNMDFPEETINKYAIPSKCIIVNINGGIKIKTKKFNGININGYNIIIPPKYKIEGYNDKFIYESNLLGKEYKISRKQILEDKIKIKNLIGEKGIINNKEFLFFP